MEFKGYTYGFYAKRGQLRSEAGYRSREALFATGTDYMCLAVVVEQKTVFSTDISFDFSWNSSDRDIMAAISHAHDNGVKVCLKPMINCSDGVWRARIDFPDSDMLDRDVYWEKWFKSYSDFLVYYAELAEETGCEMFCVGCEMCGTERKEKLWRETIAKVRGVYSGKLMYNTNHGHEDLVSWFDAVDYIGTSAYFPVAKIGGPSKEEMIKGWKIVREEMERISKKWNKPLMFAEIGCRSAATTAGMPWDFAHKDLPHDEDEQANFFDSCLEVFANEPWFSGMFWWDWTPTIYDSADEAGKDNGFNIHLKKAEEVIKKWYLK